MEIRYCNCGKILSTWDIQEGLPCKRCRQKNKIKLAPIGKMVRKPNPAKNIWGEREANHE